MSKHHLRQRLLPSLRPFVLALAVALLYLYRIGAVPLTDGDTALYAYIAKDLVRSGDWQTMRWRGGAFLDKPPLTMWGMAVGYLLFGVNEFAVRAWHSLAAVLTVLVTYAIGRQWYSERAALIGAGVLATSLQFLYQQFVPQQDVPLTLAVAAGFYFVGHSLRSGRPVWDYLAGAAFGGAVLAKGLAGVIIAGIVVATLLVLQWRHGGQAPGAILRQWVPRFGRTGLGLVAVGAPWFVAEGLRHGYPFFDLFFFGGNERFITRLSDLPRGPIYLAYLLVGFLPWSGLLWPAVRHAWERSRRGDEGDRLLLAWFAGVLILFGVLIGWKVMRYILPLYPAAAVLMGREADRLLEALERGEAGSALRALRRATLVLWVLVVPLVAAGLVALSRQFPDQARPYLDLLGPYLVGLAVTLLAVGVAWWRGKLARGLVVGMLLSALSYAVLVQRAAAGWDSVSPWRVMARVVAERYAGEVPVLFDPFMPAFGNTFLDFYMEPRPELAHNADALERHWKARRRIVVLAPREELDRFLRQRPELAVRAMVEVPAGWVVAEGYVRGG